MEDPEITDLSDAVAACEPPSAEDEAVSQAHMEMPWALRKHAAVIENPEHVLARSKSEIPIPREFRVVAISAYAIVVHCIYKEYLSPESPHTIGVLYYTTDLSPDIEHHRIWSPLVINSTTKLVLILEKIANAVMYTWRDTHALFFLTEDGSFYCHPLDNSTSYRHLEIEIPAYVFASRQSLKIVYTKLIPYACDQCIFSTDTESYFACHFTSISMPPPAPGTSYVKLDFPFRSCITPTTTSPPVLLITYPRRREDLPELDTAATVVREISPLLAVCPDDTPRDTMWIPGLDQLPGISTGNVSLEWTNSFFFHSAALGSCIALISVTTVFIHKALPPYPTEDAAIIACDIQDPIDICYLDATDSLYVINHVGEIIRIPLARVLSAKTFTLETVATVPAVSMQYALGFIPGSVFAATRESFIVFPQNTRLVNIIPRGRNTKK